MCANSGTINRLMMIAETQPIKDKNASLFESRIEIQLNSETLTHDSFILVKQYYMVYGASLF
jgi:hypothetical protein